MKSIKIITILVLACLTLIGLYAEENKTKNTTVTTNKSIQAEENTQTAPVVGKTVVDVLVTELVTTGYRATKLLKLNVYNKDGERIGIVDDLIIGGESNMSFAVISVGGFLGIGTKHIAVPAILFETDAKNKLLLPNATKESLMALPEFRYAN